MSNESSRVFLNCQLCYVKRIGSKRLVHDLVQVRKSNEHHKYRWEIKVDRFKYFCEYDCTILKLLSFIMKTSPLRTSNLKFWKKRILRKIWPPDFLKSNIFIKSDKIIVQMYNLKLVQSSYEIF